MSATSLNPLARLLPSMQQMQSPVTPPFVAGQTAAPPASAEDDLYRQLRELSEQSKTLMAELATPTTDAVSKAVSTSLGSLDDYTQKKLTAANGGRVGTAANFLTNILRSARGEPTLSDAVTASARKDYETAVRETASQVAADRNAKSQRLQALQQQIGVIAPVWQAEQKANLEQVDRRAAVERYKTASPKQYESRDPFDYEYYVNTGRMPDAKTKKSLQLFEGMINGKLGVGNYDPDTGAITAISGVEPKPQKPEALSETEALVQLKLKADAGDPKAKAELAAWEDILKKRASANETETLQALRRNQLDRDARLEGAGSPEAIKSAADKVVSGQMTVQQAFSILGGQRGGKGAELLEALDGTGFLILDNKTRDVRKDLSLARKQIDLIERLLQEVETAPSTVERAKRTALLHAEVNSMGPRLARANGHTGVLTQRDVDSTLEIVPGWVSANFAPGFARDKIKLLRENIEKNEAAIIEKYQPVRSGTGGATAPAPIRILGPARPKR